MRLVGSQRAAERLAAASDAELASLAGEGDSTAFGELYRRHAPAAWRVAQAVTGNPDDAADAVSDAFARVLQALPAGRLTSGELFRPYLLTATRNAAIDVLRRGGKSTPTSDVDRLDSASVRSGPPERLLEGEDSSFVVEAFKSLPERWRSVLWLSAVEGMAPSEIGPLLGVTANTAAQLGVRARAGLRERFLQAHLRAQVPADCQFTTRSLGAYVAGRLSPRDLAKVDQHLAACEECCARRDELEDLGSTLRRVAIPLPLMLGSAALAHWKLASATHASLIPAAKAAGAIPPSPSRLATKMHKPLLAASTGLFALGIISATVISSPIKPRAGSPRASGPTIPAAAPPVVVEQFAGAITPLPTVTDTTPIAALETAPPASQEVVGVGPAAVTAPTAVPTPPVDPPVVAPKPQTKPVASLGIAITVTQLGDAGVALGTTCVGVAVGPVAAGCTPPATDAKNAGIAIVTDGSALGPVDNKIITAGI